MAGYVQKELVIASETRYLAQIREAVAGIIQDSGFPSLEMHQIILAVDEAVANVMEHTAASNPERNHLTIRMTLNASAKVFEVVIQDSGPEFNPQEIEPPNIEEHVRAGRRKGLGLFLMRQIMDEVEYTFVQGFRNELRMVKYVQS
ncbi:MAG: ATP-binding protein [Planctomycetota bacterium]